MLKTPQPSGEYMRKLVMDENAQYFILALYWFMSNPISGKNKENTMTTIAKSLFFYSHIGSFLYIFCLSCSWIRS